MTWPPYECPTTNVGPSRGARTSRRGGGGAAGGGELEAVALQALDGAPPAGALGPCAVDEDDVRSGVHLVSPFVVASSPHRATRGCGCGIRSATALRPMTPARLTC